MRLVQMAMILFSVGGALTGCTMKWEGADLDGDGFSVFSGDCDESNADVFPGAAETWYDGVDSNCDGASDYDADGDGFDSIDHGGDDCHDDDPDAYPGSTVPETWYDCTDQDCDGNDGDQDEDGFVGLGYDESCPDWELINPGKQAGDCWDDPAEDYTVDFVGEDADRPLAAEVNPEATEEWYNGVDQDCDLADDFDQDGDGFIRADECDDEDPNVYPDDSIDEIWYNCADENCDGNDGDKDEDGFLALTYIDDNGDEQVYTETCTDWEALNPDKPEGDCWDDPDVTAFPSINGFDNLTADAVNPEAEERYYDGVDQDCAEDNDFDADGDRVNTDEYPDLDGVTGTDCQDDDINAFPGGREYCDTAYDDNCNAEINERNAEGCTNYYLDDDRDGYGDPNTSARCTCTAGEDANFDQDDQDDCDDANPSAYPGASEVTADGVDQDCDGGDTCFTDSDGDGFGDSDSSTALTSSADLDCSDNGESSVNDDCDDGASSIYPGATELPADGVDQNCDDDELCYDDDDGDGYGDSTTSTRSNSIDCDAASQGFADDDDDCDDADADAYPNASETVADGTDQDCDGFDDCYLDNDRDGYGSSTVVTGTNLNCNRPSANFANDDDDCDDTNNATGQATYPGAAFTDSGSDCMTDVDGDGYGDDSASGNVTPGTDCNDGDSDISPAATELVADGVDQNCDNDELCYDDDDGDGYGASTTSTRSNSLDCDAASSGFADDDDDCDDGAASVFPNASEVVVDGIDQDCDGNDDCYEDSDGDSFGSTTVVTGTGLNCNRSGINLANDDDDCDDTDSGINPNATELVADGVDQDCDDDELCYDDDDGDGYGDTSTSTRSNSVDCDAASSGFADDNDDCNDNASGINPGAAEVVADGVDQNCDDDELCYLDSDSDGFGSSTTSTLSNSLDCAGASGYSDVDTDCLASDPNTYPGAAYEEDPTSCRTDADGDGFGDDNPNASATAGTDCDDSDLTINTGATELVADGVDQNCDDDELCYDDVDGDGYGDTTTSTRTGSLVCDAAGQGFADDNQDCDDGDAETYPGVAFNETNAANFCHNDDDGDGWGDQNISGNVDAGADCDDSDTAISPDGNEELVCFDGVDNDCDDYYENGCFDDGTNDGEELMITELYYNDAGSDTWFEVGNESGGDIDLYGFEFVLYNFDTSTQVASFTVNATTVFADGERLVLCKNATQDHTSSICDYAYGSQAGAFNMVANDDLGVIVNTPYALDVDSVDYYTLSDDGWPELGGGDEHSVEYCDTTLDTTDNDDGANWVEIPTGNNDHRYYNGSGSNDFFGSPGLVNSCN